MNSSQIEAEKQRKDQTGSVRISVFGAGRVGLTIAAAWLRHGAHVTLADVDKSRVSKINSGEPIFRDEPGVGETVANGLKSGKCVATTETKKAASGCNCIFVAVPSGLTEGIADLSAVRSAAKDVGSSIQRGSLVSLETSVPPGTTRNILAQEIESVSGMKAGVDFYVAYSPERIFEGRALKDLEENYQKVVSGINQKSLDAAAEYYEKIARRGVIKMSSLEAAETEKLFEGIYRDVNIALANELARYCEVKGLDFWEVRSAANSQPYCHIHKPGLGVGGACIPVYPWFVIHDANEMGTDLELVRVARKLNDSQPELVVRSALAQSDLQPGDKVAVLGLAFRGDVDDDRFSPSYTAIKELLSRSLEVVVHDPFVVNTKLSGFRITKSIDEALKGAKLVIVATDHSQYEKLSFNKIAELAAPHATILDTRGMLKRPESAKREWRILGVGSRE